MRHWSLNEISFASSIAPDNWDKNGNKSQTKYVDHFVYEFGYQLMTLSPLQEQIQRMDMDSRELDPEFIPFEFDTQIFATQWHKHRIQAIVMASLCPIPLFLFPNRLFS